ATCRLFTLSLHVALPIYVELNLRPEPNAAKRIMQEVEALTPAGKTPLTAAVEQAADVLDYRQKPGVVVVLTDGEETCGGSPCDRSEEHTSELQSRENLVC